MKTDKFIKNRFFIAGFVLALFLVLAVRMTIAWLVAPGQSAVDGVEMEGLGVNFELSSVNGASNGIFYNYYTATEPDPDALVWGMTDTSKMNNYGGTDAGIEPGSSGKISFVVTPKTGSVTLTFRLEIIGYVSGSEEENGQQVITMDEISRDSLKNYLNGHILLFENYSNGKYSGLIASDADGNRTFQKTFTGENTPTTVDIYWIWPEHLSNLVNAYDGTGVTETPLLDTNGEDYSDMIGHIRSFPLYYFRGESDDAVITELAQNTETTIKNQYETYGGLYNEADNDIGTSVEFLLVTMTVSEWE